jgi:plasmid stabilization system protein ParE
MRVRHTPRSRADLVAIFDYLNERSSHGARNVSRAFERAVKLIGEHPYIGRYSGEQDSRVLPVGHYPYLVYWSVEGGEVLILHVRHAARAPWTPAP